MLGSPEVFGRLRAVVGGGAGRPGDLWQPADRRRLGILPSAPAARILCARKTSWQPRILAGKPVFCCFSIRAPCRRSALARGDAGDRLAALAVRECRSELARGIFAA